MGATFAALKPDSWRLLADLCMPTGWKLYLELGPHEIDAQCIIKSRI